MTRFETAFVVICNTITAVLTATLAYSYYAEGYGLHPTICLFVFVCILYLTGTAVSKPKAD